MASSYSLIRILQQVTVYRLMIAEAVVFGIVINCFNYLHKYLPRLDKTGPYLAVAALAGLVWVFLRLSRTPCTLVLDEDGFTATNDRHFHLLPNEPVHYRWSEFSYQSGTKGERQNQGYQITLYLKDGKSISFLTGTSSKEMAKAEQLHQDIERRMAEFLQKPVTT